MILADNDLFSHWRTCTSSHLAGAIGLLTREQPAFAAAVRYVLVGGGKRLRALLTLAILADLKGAAAAEELAMWCAAALEALHAASLVHDDLPALDNDDFRRGQPACHKVFGEATAILVGDFLVGAAFEWVTTPAGGKGAPGSRVGVNQYGAAALCRLFARAWCAVCVGQHIDITAHSDIARSDSTARVTLYQLKTGALFGAAAGSAAILAGASDRRVERLYSWGVAVGVAFQQLDDLRDGELRESELQPALPTVATLQSELEQLFEQPCPIAAQVLALVLEKGG